MAYAKLTQAEKVAAYFNNEGYSATSVPTLAQVEEWIDEGTSIIYGAISRLYVIPVVDSDDLLILRELCNSYVIEEINFAKSRGTYSTLKKGARTPREKRHTGFYTQLQRLIDGVVTLRSTTDASGKNALYGFTSTNSITAQGQKETTQW